MEEFGFASPFEVKDGRTMLHHLAKRSEINAEKDAVCRAWDQLLAFDPLRRPASWLDLIIDAPTSPGLPNRWTALDIVCNNKAEARLKMVWELVQARADMTRRRPGGAGQQPLHAAVSTANRTVVDVLLAAKADPHSRNERGSSCVDLAHTNADLKHMLVAMGVTRGNPVDAAGRSTPITNT